MNSKVKAYFPFKKKMIEYKIMQMEYFTYSSEKVLKIWRILSKIFEIRNWYILDKFYADSYPRI